MKTIKYVIFFSFLFSCTIILGQEQIRKQDLSSYTELKALPYWRAFNYRCKRRCFNKFWRCFCSRRFRIKSTRRWWSKFKLPNGTITCKISYWR